MLNVPTLHFTNPSDCQLTDWATTRDVAALGAGLSHLYQQGDGSLLAYPGALVVQCGQVRAVPDPEYVRRRNDLVVYNVSVRVGGEERFTEINLTGFIHLRVLLRTGLGIKYLRFSRNIIELRPVAVEWIVDSNRNILTCWGVFRKTSLVEGRFYLYWKFKYDLYLHMEENVLICDDVVVLRQSENLTGNSSEIVKDKLRPVFLFHNYWPCGILLTVCVAAADYKFHKFFIDTVGKCGPPWVLEPSLETCQLSEVSLPGADTW